MQILGALRAILTPLFAISGLRHCQWLNCGSFSRKGNVRTAFSLVSVIHSCESESWIKMLLALGILGATTDFEELAVGS